MTKNAHTPFGRENYRYTLSDFTIRVWWSGRPRVVFTVSGCLDVSKMGSTYIRRHVHPQCTSSAGATYPQTCRGPQQTLLLVKMFVLVPVESFGIGGKPKCTWQLPKTSPMYREPGPAEQDNFFKVCPGNQKPWLCCIHGSQVIWRKQGPPPRTPDATYIEGPRPQAPRTRKLFTNP
jgi:hypothetical protein